MNGITNGWLRWAASCALSLAFAAAVGSEAWAQEERGRLTPHAITPAELDHYAENLELSVDQRHAIEFMHEEYLDRFAPLREQMIDVAARAPIRRVFEQDSVLIERLPGWIAQVRALDEQFFHDMAGPLTGAQRERMHRLRLRRERDLYNALEAFVWTIGDNVPDLSRFVLELDLAAPVRERIDPVVQDYEERLTSGLRHLLTALLRDCGNPQDLYRFGVPLDPDGNPIIIEPEPVDTTQALIDRVRELRELNRRTHDELAPRLPEPQRDALRRLFYSRAYGSAYERASLRVLPALDRALALEGVAEDDRLALAALRDELRGREAAFFERLARITDDEVIRVSFPGETMRGSALHDAINALTREKNLLEHEAWRTLHGRLGDRRAEVPYDEPRMGRSRASWRGLCNVRVYAQWWVEHPRIPDATARYGDELTPSFIDPVTFRAMVNILAPSDDDRPSLDEAYREYREEVEERARRLATDLMMARQRTPGDHGEPVSPEERRQRIEEAREALRSAMNEMDRKLFAMIRRELDLDDADPRLERIKALRERETLAIRALWSFEPEVNLAGRLDVVALAAREDVLSALPAEAEGTLHEYESQMRDALRRQRELVLQQAEAANRPRTGGMTMDEHRAQSERITAAQVAVREAHRIVGELNRTFANRLADALPPHEADRLRTAFARAAYPPAFDDPNDMRELVAAALAIDGMPAARRERVLGVRAAHIEAYEEHRARIIALCQAFMADLPREMGTVEAERSRELRMWRMRIEALQLERDRINRAVRREIRRAVPGQFASGRIDWPRMQ